MGSLSNFSFVWGPFLECHYDLVDPQGKKWRCVRNGGRKGPGHNEAIFNNRVGWRKHIRDCVWSEHRDAGVPFPYESGYEQKYEARAYFGLVRARTPIAPPPQLATAQQVGALQSEIVALNAALSKANADSSQHAAANQAIGAKLDQLQAMLDRLLRAG